MAGIRSGAALHSTLYFVGANHNFFNTEWTPGRSEAPSSNDFSFPDDAVCSPGAPTRLTAAQQQTAGATYVAATARLFVAADPEVLPLLDGTGMRAPSADPARIVSHDVGGARAPFIVPSETTTAGGGARLCEQVTADAASACTGADISWRQPHFVQLGLIGEDPDRFAVALSGSGAIRPAAAVSLAGSHSLASRLIVPPNSTGNRFDVTITDTQGRTARLGGVSLDGLPATEQVSAFWAQEVRVPLPADGIDLREVASLELAGGGQAWLIDAYGWQPGLPDPRPVALPRVDVGAMTVEEGDSGSRTVQIPVTGNGAGTVRVFTGDQNNGFTPRLVTIQPGQHTIDIPFEVTGNTRWSTTMDHMVVARAVQGTVAGGYLGGLTVLNDDQKPTVTVTPTAEVAEGGVLTWTVTLSAEADSPFFWFVFPIPSEQGPELSSTDVDPQWFRENAGAEPGPEPLWATALLLTMVVPPGALTTEVTVPTVVDDEVEQTEYVRLFLFERAADGADVEVTGAVID